ncbi:MAG: hypothetical protein JO352_00825 [Chloroflexi bacterium]|nr:hypothetical protein [Chloroflexota bacterium]
MPAIQVPRFTQSGACATCGAYGGTQHRPNCRPRTGPRFRLGRMRNVRRDARNSAAVREKMRVDDELVRDL